MMMGALVDGGYRALYSPDAHANLSEGDDEAYKFNPREVWEFDPDEWKNPRFPQQYPNHALKVRYNDVMRLAPMAEGIHFVQMRRHPEEIRQSVEAMSDQKAEGWLSVPGEYERRMDWSKAHAENRRDALSFTVVDYPLGDPCAEFARLPFHLDVPRAAAGYRPDLYRFRLSELEVGI